MTSRRRAFTLIELLIVVAVLVVLGSLAITSSFRWSDEERVESAQQGISSAILEARSAALEQGVPVDVVYVAPEYGLPSIGMIVSTTDSEPSGAAINSEFNQDSIEPIPALLYELPERLAVVFGAVSDTGFVHETDILAEPMDSFEDDETRLVRVMPDGHASLSEDSWELEADDRRFQPAIENWTGRLTFQEIVEDDFYGVAGGGEDISE